MPAGSVKAFIIVRMPSIFMYDLALLEAARAP